jgi:hypothetical protein
MLLNNLSATVAAHVTTWQVMSLPNADPTPGPDIFDGKTSSQVDDATSNVVANVLLVLGAIAFVGFVAGLLLQALTKKSYTKAIALTAIAMTVTLGPGAIMKWVDGGISGIFS